MVIIEKMKDLKKLDEDLKKPEWGKTKLMWHTGTGFTGINIGTYTYESSPFNLDKYKKIFAGELEEEIIKDKVNNADI